MFHICRSRGMSRTCCRKHCTDQCLDHRRSQHCTHTCHRSNRKFLGRHCIERVQCHMRDNYRHNWCRNHHLCTHWPSNLGRYFLLVRNRQGMSNRCQLLHMFHRSRGRIGTFDFLCRGKVQLCRRMIHLIKDLNCCYKPHNYRDQMNIIDNLLHSFDMYHHRYTRFRRIEDIPSLPIQSQWDMYRICQDLSK